jgi:hypothetical protein
MSKLQVEETSEFCLGFEVFTAVVIFWAVMPCIRLETIDVSKEYVASFKVEE